MLIWKLDQCNLQLLVLPIWLFHVYGYQFVLQHAANVNRVEPARRLREVLGRSFTGVSALPGMEDCTVRKKVCSTNYYISGQSLW